jgi:malate synthase
MAAQIPIKNDAAANESALDKVRRDKLREVKAGHDGTWVAHPGLVPIAKEIFDEHMPTPNQISNKREDVHITQADLLSVPEGHITETGLRLNIDVGIQYLESWLLGFGCVPIYNLMEDAATAEISRTQVWQWLHHRMKLDDGRQITPELIKDTIASQLQHIRHVIGAARYDGGKFPQAAQIFEQMMLSEKLPEFLTLEAYKYID